MENTEEIKEKFNTKKIAILVIGLAIIIGGGIFAYFTYFTDDSDFADKEKNLEEVVALVGGKDITRSELDFQIEQMAAMQQILLPDKETAERKELERQILSQMIELTLLLKDAENQGIMATEEEINDKYSIIATQMGGEEALKQELQRMGMTQERLRKELEIEVVVKHYLDFLKEKYEITVTEEEIKVFYEEQVAVQQPDLEFELVELQIRQQIEQQKLEQPILETFQRLREEMKIEIYL